MTNTSISIFSRFIRRRHVVYLLIILTGTSCSIRDLTRVPGDGANLVKFVNPLIGTQSSPELSAGNTYPAVAVPWGMNFWTPQTGSNNSSTIYRYDARTIQGFRCTHQPGPDKGDYGAFNLMPMTGELIIDGDKRASQFNHANEISMPHYYSVRLDRYNIKAEMAPTTRGAIMRFTYPETDAAYVVFDALPGGSRIRVVPQQRRIIGFTENNQGGVPKNFNCYFVLEFDKDFLSYAVWNNDSLLTLIRDVRGEHAGVAIRFSTERNEAVTVKISTSFISVPQAILNFQRELERNTFDQAKIRANQTWNEELNRIQIEGGTVDQQIVFYSALYRMLLFPRIFYEYDETGKMKHFSPYNGAVHDGYMYADIGLWENFRTLFPFHTLMYPEMSASFMQWLVNAYKEGGWLPVWPSPGYRRLKTGTHAASLFADAYLKGVRNFDVEMAYQAMKKDAFVIPPRYAPGRDGLKAYNDLGYVPFPDFTEATSKTLEYAYNDFCIMQMARALDQDDDFSFFREKAKNYRNVFDSTTNFMRGRRADRSWHRPFDPIEWGGPYHEGNAWHHNWTVFHDVDGLIALMGGRERFVDKLDSVFLLPPEFKVGSYGRVIHEMTEMVLSDMGQYAHSNQVVHHLPYLYSYAGEPSKTQKWVREIMNKFYAASPDGYCGDEDNGQMSSWFVFSALGFYPANPGHPSYVLGAPLFKKAVLNLENGKKFVIEAPDNSPDNRYVELVDINGRRISRNWIGHNEIKDGGTLIFRMDNKPNRRRGTGDEDMPYSLSRERDNKLSLY